MPHNTKDIVMKKKSLLQFYSECKSMSLHSIQKGQTINKMYSISDADELC